MKECYFAAWKNRFMKETNPETGTKTGIQLDDCHATWLDQIRFMDSIEGIEYFIMWQSGPENTGIVTFETLDEFKEAQSYAANHAWNSSVARIIKKFSEVKLIPMNEGYAPLCAIFPNTPENIQKFNQAGMLL